MIEQASLQRMYFLFSNDFSESAKTKENCTVNVIMKITRACHHLRMLFTFHGDACYQSKNTFFLYIFHRGRRDTSENLNISSNLYEINRVLNPMYAKYWSEHLIKHREFGFQTFPLEQYLSKRIK